ncbi:MAG: hypothetical protein EA399_11240 [Desulfovibrionales bacterium]|nr:MAG: hypothetical protein EA399_11240 [Desulfovibrionales bacterium]
MNQPLIAEILEKYNLNSEDQYHRTAFSRNVGLLSPGELERLAKSTVAIAGMGGVGGVHLITLVRSGVGRFHLADYDLFEPVNINRQYGARVPDFGRPKLDVMSEQATAINPFVHITPFAQGVTSENMDAFLEGVDVVLDGLDFFQFTVRRELFNRARALGIPVITAGPLGFSSALLVFTAQGMGFDQYFDVHDALPEEEKYLRFALGLAPRATHLAYMDTSRVDLKSKKGPSLYIACQICSALAAAEAVRIILGRPGQKPAPHFFQVDPYTLQCRRGQLRGGNRNPAQRLKIKVARTMLIAATSGPTGHPPTAPASPEGPGPLPEDVLAYIIRAGIQAPSGDNAQPWRFSVRDDTISLFLNPAADTSFFNVNQYASIIACGAALENMRLAATRFGLTAKTMLVPDPVQPTLMGRLPLEQVQCPPDPLEEHVWWRCTNRKPLQKHPLPQWMISRLQRETSLFSGTHLHLLTERKQLRKLAKIVFRADRIRSEHRDLHEHFMSMVRFTPEEAETDRTGLPLKNLEAGLQGELFLKMTRPWSVMKVFNALGMSRMVASYAAQGILNSGAAGLISVDGRETADFLRGGQALQRIWLVLDYLGLRMQPMTAITLFRLRVRDAQGQGFSPGHAALLEKLWGDYQALFPALNLDSHSEIMLFRMGYGPAIRHRTWRQDEEHLRA